jgi:hypothetical protein
VEEPVVVPTLLTSGPCFSLPRGTQWYGLQNDMKSQADCVRRGSLRLPILRLRHVSRKTLFGYRDDSDALRRQRPTSWLLRAASEKKP